MLNKILSLLFISGLFFLEACDPAGGVSIINNTDREIKVKVISPNHPRLNFNNDSVSFDDNSNRLVRAIKDSIDGSFHFTIGKYTKCWVEGGVGFHIDKNQKIIIDEKDTLTFDNDPRMTKEGTFMARDYVFTIK